MITMRIEWMRIINTSATNWRVALNPYYAKLSGRSAARAYRLASRCVEPNREHPSGARMIWRSVGDPPVEFGPAISIYACE